MDNNILNLLDYILTFPMRLGWGGNTMNKFFYDKNKNI